AAALHALGVTDHGFLDEAVAPDARYEDSGMAWVGAGRAGEPDEVPLGSFSFAPREEAAEGLARILRARRPQVVVTYEPGGGYGHPDHVRTHDVTMLAVERATTLDDPLSPSHVVPVVLWSVVGRSALRRAQVALAGDAVLAALGRTIEEMTL